MGFADDLARLGQGLVDSINGLKVQRAVAGARDELDAIKSSEWKDEQKKSAIRALGQDLAMNLTVNAGLSPQTAQGFAEQIAPKPPLIQSIDQGLLSDDPTIRSQAQKVRDAQYQQQMNLKQAEYDAGLAKFGVQSNQKTDEKIAKMRQEAKAGQLGKLYESFTQAQKTQEALAKFAQNPNGYTDYGTLMGGLKSLQGDSSVVREAEITLGKNATSLFNKAANALSQAIDGTSLRAEQRKDITDALSVLSAAGKTKYLQAAKPIYNEAVAKKLPLNQIFDQPEAFGALPDYMRPAPPPQSEGASPSPASNFSPTGSQPPAPAPAQVPAQLFKPTSRTPQSTYDTPTPTYQPSESLTPFENAYNEIISRNPARAAAWGTYKAGQVPLKVQEPSQINRGIVSDAEQLVATRAADKAAAARAQALQKKLREEEDIRYKRALAKSRAKK